MQNLIFVMPPDENSESEAIKLQFEHYLKMMDVFETRQTWVFNFAIVVYLGALSTLGPILEHVLEPALAAIGNGKQIAPHLDALVLTFVSLFSVLLPLLILPLCYLYVDVSIFCSALAAGTMPILAKRFGSGYRDPGGKGFDWLAEANQQPVTGWRSWFRRQRLDVDGYAHGRTFLFLLAPLCGLLVAIAAVIAEVVAWNYAPTLSSSPLLMTCLSIVGLVVSGYSFVQTKIAREQTAEARGVTRDIRVGSVRKP